MNIVMVWVLYESQRGITRRSLVCDYPPSFLARQLTFRVQSCCSHFGRFAIAGVLSLLSMSFSVARACLNHPDSALPNRCARMSDAALDDCQHLKLRLPRLHSPQAGQAQGSIQLIWARAWPFARFANGAPRAGRRRNRSHIIGTE